MKVATREEVTAMKASCPSAEVLPPNRKEQAMYEDG